MQCGGFCIRLGITLGKYRINHASVTGTSFILFSWLGSSSSSRIVRRENPMRTFLEDIDFMLPTYEAIRWLQQKTPDGRMNCHVHLVMPRPHSADSECHASVCPFLLKPPIVPRKIQAELAEFLSKMVSPARHGKVIMADLRLTCLIRKLEKNRHDVSFLPFGIAQTTSTVHQPTALSQMTRIDMMKPARVVKFRKHP